MLYILSFRLELFLTPELFLMLFLTFSHYYAPVPTQMLQCNVCEIYTANKNVMMLTPI